jgi:hypothetical protein
MAFLRRKGNSYYLVHNVRQRGKVRQIHLARLGDRPRITDEVVRQVTRQHPFLNLNWRQLREQVNSRVELFDARSASVQKLLDSLRSLNLDLADLFPSGLVLCGTLNPKPSDDVTEEILLQLRLLQSTVGVKLDQFREAKFRDLPGERILRMRG